ncbi:MAG TPA: hypothetical protein VFH44_05650 [Solirubrobacterales bacterium]|nr:hypothetical protein [Solirubrobacterales bacterium]
MDFSKLSRSEWVGLAASALLVIAVLFLPWFDLAEGPSRVVGSDTSGFLCGDGEFSCTGFETFPILRWLLLAAAAAPWILAWIVVRGHTLSWPPGELTMTVGFTAFVLIAYNGIIDPPGSGNQEIDITKVIGYYVALLAALGIAVAGIWRSMEEAGDRPRRAPGTV